MTGKNGNQGTPRPLSPREVSGYTAARAAGLLPIVPTMPPSLLPGASSKRMLVRAVIVAFVSIFAFIPMLKLATGHVTTFVGVFIAIAGMFAVVLRMLRNVHTLQLEELNHGYSLVGKQSGAFTFSSWRRPSASDDPEGGVPWDFSGVWVLSDKGAVISVPIFGIDSPGFYPSPHRPEAMELWTGCAWSGVFKKLG